MHPFGCPCSGCVSGGVGYLGEVADSPYGQMDPKVAASLLQGAGAIVGTVGGLVTSAVQTKQQQTLYEAQAQLAMQQTAAQEQAARLAEAQRASPWPWVAAAAAVAILGGIYLTRR